MHSLNLLEVHAFLPKQTNKKILAPGAYFLIKELAEEQTLSHTKINSFNVHS